MDYNDFELIAAVGWLCLIGPLAAVISAVLLYQRRPDGISHWYLLCGIILILDSWVGGLLAGLGTVLCFAISQSIYGRRKCKALQDGKLAV